MKTEEILSILGRIPVAPLSYAEKDKAQPGELMMDYDDDIGHLYMKSKKTGEIVDLDKNIGDINDTTADDIKVTIDGVSTTLYELLTYMKVQIGRSVTVKLLDNDVVYTQKRYAYDQNSIETNLDNIQIAGFNTAPELSVPMKKDGKTVWVALSDFIGNGSSSIPGGSNSDDGLVSTVIDLQPLNDKIYLLASKKQVSKYLPKSYKVYLPKTMDSYSEINWALLTNSYAPKLYFQTNVIWMYKDNTQPSINNTNVYIFKTWDNGATWYGEINKYNRQAVTDGNGNSVDIDVLSKFFPTRTEIENNYYTKDDAEFRFLDDAEASEKYYSKEEVINIVSWKNKEGVK